MPTIVWFHTPHYLYTIDGLIIAVIVLAFVAKAYRRYRQKVLLAKSGIQDIDRMKGRVFEEYLAVVFRKKGYHVKLTQASKDQGADLVISKDGIRIVVQAKRWRGNVGNKAVQEVVASKPYYKADRAMIVTNSFFTKPAKELAKANHVELWDRIKLIDELVHAHAKEESALLPASDPEESTPGNCPKCGGKLVVRHRREDQQTFWGCSNYPECRYVQNT